MRGDRRALAGALIAMAIGWGCAGSGDTNEAQQARQAAEDADRKADLAFADAAAARATAEAAVRDAQEANAKADRTFRHSLHA